MNQESIVLTGMSGVGKSTIGKLLAVALGFAFIDVDEYIREKDGKTVQQVIDEEGDQALVRLEKERIYEIDLKRKVLAPGGSIIYSPDLMEYLRRNSTLVYLYDSLENIEKKITNASSRGIVGLKSKSIGQIYRERSPIYTKYAEITVDCRDKTAQQIASEVLDACGISK